MHPSIRCVVALGVLAASATASAAISIDLSYVDTASANYTRFKSFVDNAVAHPTNPGYGFSAADAAWMFRITGQTQYCDLAVSLVDAQVAAAEQAISAAGVPAVAGDSYLQSGPMITDVALAYDWCAARTTSLQRTRWSAYAEQAIYNIWNFNSASWGGHPRPWSGWSTDNPGDNYYYSFMAATMYWALASDSSVWTTFLRLQKIPLLENYFAALPGGGSREGTGYGTSHKNLFLLYRIWRDSTDQDMATSNPHLTESILYWTHATVPTLDRFAPIGDQSRSSIPELYDYHRHLMLEARRMTDDASAASVASWWLDHISVAHMTSSFNYRFDLLPAGTNGSPPASLIYHAEGAGHLFARTGWDTAAAWLDFSAGPYVESHAHQDQGAFTLFQGDWLAVTQNIWSHSGIQQGTEVANVVRFSTSAGATIPQRANTTSTLTINATGVAGAVNATGHLGPAYASNSGVHSWDRTIDFASRSLTVHDSFNVDAGIQATFQINVPVQPTVNGSTITAGNLVIHVLTPANPTITLVNWAQQDSDYNSGWRIDIHGAGNTFDVQLAGPPQGDAVFRNGFD
ncbi:MAG: hypothetical protein ABIR62_12825 [Dokdonella sp.]|uniref:hypothetical protein n=1 Tax=Dokdonella sp. TaxID=2291710 RepID=UPI0032659E89